MKLKSLILIYLVVFHSLSFADDNINKNKALIEDMGNSIDAYVSSDKDAPKILQHIQNLIDQGVDPYVETEYAPMLEMPFSYGKPELMAVLLSQSHNKIGSKRWEYTGQLLIKAVAGTSQKNNERRVMVSSLLKAGANVNARFNHDFNYTTPLYYAANDISGVDVELMNMLLNAGADMNLVKDEILITESAANLKALKVLIQAGANPYAQNANGVTPLDHVCPRMYDEIKPDPEAVERINILLNPKRDINISGRMGHVLLNAANSKNTDCLNALIQAGADVDAPAYPSAKESVYEWERNRRITYHATDEPVVLELFKKHSKK